MRKNLVFVLLFLTCSLVAILRCTDEENIPILTTEAMLEIVQHHYIHHLQSEKEIERLKLQKIKSVSVIREGIDSSVVDSLTLLRIDKKGRIISKTTNECTTIGCLPYPIIQIYSYSDNHIIKMNDFTFKKKYIYKNNYWQIQDTSKLYLLDWEVYTYSEDTLFVESATQKWKFVKDDKRRLAASSSFIKSIKKRVNSKYYYAPNSIVKEILGSDTMKTIIKVIDSNKVEKKFPNLIPGKSVKHIIIFNYAGLIEEIGIYSNEKLKSKMKFSYSTE